MTIAELCNVITTFAKNKIVCKTKIEIYTKIEIRLKIKINLYTKKLSEKHSKYNHVSKSYTDDIRSQSLPASLTAD